jgi:hypothetical protein
MITFGSSTFERMSPIESQLAELNFMEQYEVLDAAPDMRTRTRQIFVEFVRQGYNIITPGFVPDSPEYGILSEDGKQICDRLVLIRKTRRKWKPLIIRGEAKSIL